MEYSRINSTCITNWKNWFSYLTVYSLNRPKLRYNEQSFMKPNKVSNFSQYAHCGVKRI